MKNRIAAIAVIALIAGFSSPAFAGHCPKDVKAIDAALAKSPTLSAAQMTNVKALRDEGETLHKTGKHKASLDKLHEAMKILGLKH